MNKALIFIQGGGAYETDAKLVTSLQTELGSEYKIHYPQMPADEDLPDYGWLGRINEVISSSKNEIILVGHSFGASMLLKYLSEYKIEKNIIGIFLIATPFWSGDEKWKQSFKLQQNFADNLPKDTPIFFYHSRDDEVVSFSHFKTYQECITRATFHEIETGGHQLESDLSIVAKDIKSI